MKGEKGGCLGALPHALFPQRRVPSLAPRATHPGPAPAWGLTHPQNQTSPQLLPGLAAAATALACDSPTAWPLSLLATHSTVVLSLNEKEE